ncbi:MAG: hypothetical protein IAG13_38940 [Deltaproteobacteria bacterium]|nr:hypothetical protein [Nannocystaceae bacterium]
MTARTKPSVFSRLWALSIAFALLFPSLPQTAWAAPAKPAATAPATNGRTIAMLRFSGTSSTDLRASIQSSLEEKSYTVKPVALDLAAAAAKVKCKADPASDECIVAIGKWLNSNPKTAADFIVHGRYVAGTPNRAEVVVFDIAKGALVRRFDVNVTDGDMIAPVVVPMAIAQSLEDYITPPGPITEQEQAILDALDEPDKTPEEIAAESKAVTDAEDAAAKAAAENQVIDTSSIQVDLKADFKDFCRTGPRTKRKTKEDRKDLRPKCQRGPFFGYWQPRAWVALGLTLGSLAGMAAFYGAALAARGPYNDATDELDDYLADVAPRDPRKDPTAATNGDQSYDALATEVSRTGSIVRRRAIIGDVLLGTSAVLFGVLAIIVFQDRTDAKNFIREEKGLRMISRIKAAPIFTKGGGGFGLGLTF